MLNSGLPARLAPALRFLFTGDSPPEVAAVSARVERLRAGIAGRPEIYRFVYSPSPLGRIRWLEQAGTPSAGPTVSARHLANIVSVSPRWGIFLHLCAEAFEAKAVLELGACVGISGAYLASARSRPRFVTLEGSAVLARVAEATLAEVTSRATVIEAPFEKGLHEALALFDQEIQTIDVAYIDGHHDEAATIEYVRAVVPHLSRGALIVLDDIHLYAEMWRAWQTVVSIRGFSAAVNVGRFGLLVWEGGDSLAARYDLSRYTGWWPVGGSRLEAGDW